MKKIAILASIPFFINAHLENKINYLLKKKYCITIITKSDNSLEKIKKNKNLNIVNLNFSRKISLFYDFYCLFFLFFHFIFNRYNIIHSYTPKVGLLTSISAKITLNKIVIHTFTGQYWKNYKGFKRNFFKILDRIIIKLNFACFADSYSQIDFLLKENVCKNNEIQIINHGSVGGINFNKFNKNLFDRKFILETLRINDESFVITFIGRVNCDKGIFQLINAVINSKHKIKNVILLIIGPLDFVHENESNKFLNILNNNENIIYQNYSNEVEKFLFVSNLFCLPSLREGFGTSVIEAGSMHVPVLVSDIYGLNEIVNKNNGFLLIDNTSKEIENKIISIYEDYNHAKKLANNFFNDIKQKYNSIDICNKIEDYYKKILNI